MKFIILSTDWKFNYWSTGGRGKYTKCNFTKCENWQEFRDNCPIPALGIYFGNYIEHKIDYLVINGIELENISGEPTFDYKYLGTDNFHKSTEIWSKIPNSNQYLFYTFNDDFIYKIISELNLNPPQKWLDLLGDEFTREEEIRNLEKLIDWKSLIGNYFVEITSKDINNTEFEDRVCDLLVAIGFGVEQKGHKIIGKYPDGVACFNDFAMVYDCKNRTNYYPNTSDFRAINEYYNNEKRVDIAKRQLFKVFIAKSFDNKIPTNVSNMSYIDINLLLYLLAKKTIQGNEFNLQRFVLLLNQNRHLNLDDIDNEFIGQNRKIKLR